MRIYSAVYIYILALNASVTVLSECVFKYNQVMLDHFYRPWTEIDWFNNYANLFCCIYILALNASVTVLSECIFKYNQVMLDHFYRPWTEIDWFVTCRTLSLFKTLPGCRVEHYITQRISLVHFELMRLTAMTGATTLSRNPSLW